MSEQIPAEQAPVRTMRERIRLIVKVVEVRLRFVVILVGTGLLIGYWETIQNHWDRWMRPRPATTVALEAGSEFYCPMHPQVVRDRPEPNGAAPNCPICGMPLSLRKKGAALDLPASVTGRVQLSPDRIRLAGVATVPVEARVLVREVRAVGYVRYDETRLAVIASRVEGYLEKLLVDRTFQAVEAGQPLVEIYSPDLYAAASELLVAQPGHSPELLIAARRKLKLLGVAPTEIDAIGQAGKATDLLVMRAPQAGHVIRKAVVTGAHVNRGDTLFEIADLSSIWIEADIYEQDLPFLSDGQGVSATVEALPGRTFPGIVALVHPHVDSTTRTVTVRFAVANPKHELRPGMSAIVTLSVPLTRLPQLRPPPRAPTGRAPVSAARAASMTSPLDVWVCPDRPDEIHLAPGTCGESGTPRTKRTLGGDETVEWWCPMHSEITADHPGEVCQKCGGMKLVPHVVQALGPGTVLAIPESSVIDTGRRKVVYVEVQPTVFEGREVELGPRVAQWYPVVSGLVAGQRIVTRGAFLVDAETRLNPAVAGAFTGAAGGPKSGGGAP